MKPTTGQKAQVMVDPPESCEEVRATIAEIVTIISSTVIFECLRPYVDQMVGICRALCMDPCGSVIIEGCAAMRELAKAGGNQLLHFCENMGRALFTAFVHKHAKVRIAGLKSLYDVAVCGAYKFSYAIFEKMQGQRDPHIVPIKEFYEPTNAVNYFAMFVADRSTQVREFFYKTMGDLLMRLPDRHEMEPRIFPYLISGLFDHNDEIKQLTFDIIEQLGELYEETNEAELREMKQFGFKSEWQLGGKIKDAQVVLPFPIIHRPRLGSRMIIRQYVRRYIKNVQHEVSCWIEENAGRASYLLLYSIIYTEDHMTQFLDKLFIALYRAIMERGSKTVMKNIPLSFKYIARYCNPQTYQPLIIQAIRNELAAFYAFTQAGSIKAFGHIFDGAIEILPETSDLDRISGLLHDFIDAVKSVVLDGLDLELA